MDLIELNEVIKDTFDKLGVLNSIVNGDVYNIWSNDPKIQYSSLVYDVKSMIVNDNTIDFTYTFYLGDRLLEDMTNYNDIYQNNYKILENGLAKLNDNDKILSISGNRGYQFVKQKFADVLAVSYVDVTISVSNDTDRC